MLYLIIRNFCDLEIIMQTVTKHNLNFLAFLFHFFLSESAFKVKISTNYLDT